MNLAVLSHLFERPLALLGETIFPTTCGLCRKPGMILCDSCRISLANTRRQSQVCGSCGTRETPHGRLCHACGGSVAHDGLFSAFHYSHPGLARLIHLYKYRFIHDLGEPLGSLLAQAVLTSDLPLPDALVPVPLHPRRKRWRGWNQSDILAETLARHFPEDIAPALVHALLIRTRYTAPQMSVRNKIDRKKNIENAFRLNPSCVESEIFDIRNKRIWIIDDVAASGETIAACAHILKTHGAREVIGVVVAR